MAVCGYELIKWKKNCFFGTVSIHHWQNWYTTYSLDTMTSTTTFWIQLSERGALQFLKYGIFKEKVYVMWLSIVVCGEKNSAKMPCDHNFWSIQAFRQWSMNSTQDDCTQGYLEAFQTAEKIFASFSCNDFHLCGKKTALDNWKIVARLLSFKLAWKGAPSHPL